MRCGKRALAELGNELAVRGALPFYLQRNRLAVPQRVMIAEETKCHKTDGPTVSVLAHGHPLPLTLWKYTLNTHTNATSAPWLKSV